MAYRFFYENNALTPHLKSRIIWKKRNSKFVSWEKYPLRSNPDLEELATGEAECYIHTDVRFGLRESLWEKVGKAYIHDNFDAKFIVEPHDGLDSMWTAMIT